MNVAKVKEAESNAPPAKAPQVDPNNVVLNASGLAFQVWFARMLEGVVAEDVRRPELWRKVQSRRDKCLRRFDTVRCVGFNEDWLVDCIVSDATGERAILEPSRVVSIGRHFDNLYQDEKYRLVWVGNGYAIERKSDGIRMSEPRHTVELAMLDLRNLYPKAA